MSRKGSLLEQNVERIFRLSGLEPKTNVTIHGYEIDVFVRHEGREICVECKQYERSSLTVRNLVHQWHSKNETLSFDRVILAIVGQNISAEDEDLADEHGIVIWDGQTVDDLLERAIDEGGDNLPTLLSEMKLPPRRDESRTHESPQRKLIHAGIQEALTWGEPPTTIEIFLADAEGQIAHNQGFAQFSWDGDSFHLHVHEAVWESEDLVRVFEEVINILRSAGLPDQEIRGGWGVYQEQQEYPLPELDLEKASRIGAKLGPETDEVAYVAEQILVYLCGMTEDDNIIVRTDATREMTFSLREEEVRKGELRSVDSRCFIATHIYGNSAWETQFLRAYRDKVLEPSLWGRFLVKVYYGVGPLLVEVIGRSSRLRSLSRRLLDGLIDRLRA